MRRLLVTLGVFGVVSMALQPAAMAQDKSFYLPTAEVLVEVRPDGSLRVTEQIQFSFSGDFSGAYRDIPVRDGEQITDITVTEDDREYSPGASAELGSSGSPDTFGVAYLDDVVRVVWHYSAANESRTFEIGYTFRGLAVAYDDVVDVNLQVWGDEWKVELSSLRATMRVPGAAPGEIRVWGHPATVEGITVLNPDGTGAELWANAIRPGYFAEMRMVFPRSLLSDTSGARRSSKATVLTRSWLRNAHSNATHSETGSGSSG